MSNDKKNPTNIESSYFAKATDELEEEVAEDLDAEDPADAEEVIASLAIVEDVEEEEEEEEESCGTDCECSDSLEPKSPPVRHRGPKPDGSA